MTQRERMAMLMENFRNTERDSPEEEAAWEKLSDLIFLIDNAPTESHEHS